MKKTLTYHLALNTLFQLIGRFSSTLLSFLLTYLIIHLAGFSLYGDYLKVTSLLYLNFVVIDFGINAFAVKLLKTSSSPKNILSQVLELRFLLALLVFCLTLLVLHFLPLRGYPHYVKTAYLFSFTSLFFFAFSLTANALFQTQLAFYKQMVSTILGGLTTLTVSLLVLIVRPHLTFLIIAFSLGYLVIALASFFFLRPLKLHLRFSSLPRSLFISSLPLGLTLLTSFLANKTDLFVIALYRSSVEVGHYGFAYKIFDVLLILPSFLLNSAYPTLITSPRLRFRRTSRLLKTLFVISLFLGSFVFFVSFPLSTWLPKYSPSFFYLRLLSLSLPLFFLSPPLMWFFIARGNEWLLVPIYFVGFLLNFLLNLLFVPSYGPSASALITLVTELFFTVFLFIKFVKLVHHEASTR